MFGIVGDIMINVGDILSTMGGYPEYIGDIEYRGGIMMHVGDITSTVRVFSTVGIQSFVT